MKKVFFSISLLTLLGVSSVQKAGVIEAQAGYALCQYMEANGYATTGAVALIGGTGRVVGTWLGLKYGTALGSLAGPIGGIVGGTVGAL